MIENLKISSHSQIFILTGAGISKESGIQTFRESDGLWNNHKIEDVASPQGFYRNPSLVYDFYNKRRKELNSGIEPNKAHFHLYELEKYFKIHIITQNIDNLHEKAGSTSIVHMHGELNKVRCILNEKHIFEWLGDLNENHRCPICNSKMRPHIVWFGEIPMEMEKINEIAERSDLFVSIGTSGAVYPAAGFVTMFKSMKKPTVELNLEPSLNQHQFDFSIYKPATLATQEFKDILFQNL